MMREMRLLYPERRRIMESEVISWARDLYANDAPRRRCTGCGRVTVAVHHGQPVVEVRAGEYRADAPDHPCVCVADTIPMYDPDQHPPLGLEQACEYLEDLGVATFARS